MSKKKRVKTPFSMSLPASITVGGTPYEVRDDPHLEDFGECEVVSKVIRINIKKHLTLQQLLVTWHHETGHAIAEEYGVNMNEKNTDRMAQGRTQVFKDWMEAQ